MVPTWDGLLSSGAYIYEKSIPCNMKIKISKDLLSRKESRPENCFWGEIFFTLSAPKTKPLFIFTPQQACQSHALQPAGGKEWAKTQNCKSTILEWIPIKHDIWLPLFLSDIGKEIHSCLNFVSVFHKMHQISKLERFQNVFFEHAFGPHNYKNHVEKMSSNGLTIHC